MNIINVKQIIHTLYTGADPGFFLALCFTINYIFFWQNIHHIRKLLVNSRGGGGVYTTCALPLDPPMVHHTEIEGVYAVETRVMFNIDRLSALEQTFTSLFVCFQVVKEAEQMKKNQTLISHMRFSQQELVNYLR